MRKRRVDPEKEFDRISSIRIVRQTVEGVEVTCCFHFTGKVEAVPKRVWIPFPQPEIIRNNLRLQHPKRTRRRIENDTQTLLKQHVEMQLKKFWLKHKPNEESLSLESEIRMDGAET